MRILLIEDNNYKSEQIQFYIENNFSNIEIVLRKSYNSGLRELIRNSEYNLILLDMSLPNYDIEPGESGGDFENAGEYLLEEMYRRDINIDVVIVTMYHNYVDENMDSNLKENFKNYLGVIYFDLNDPDTWKNELKTKIEVRI